LTHVSDDSMYSVDGTGEKNYNNYLTDLFYLNNTNIANTEK